MTEIEDKRSNHQETYNICKECKHHKKYHDEKGCHHTYGVVDYNKVCLCLRFKGMFWRGK